MAEILVTYYSRSGNTEQMAELVARGARDAGADVDLEPVEEVSVDDLTPYDGIIVGSPTYYGGMSAELKELFDQSVRHHGRLEGIVGGAFSSSANVGGGNESTILSIIQAMLIHGMIVQGTSEGDHYGPVAVGAPDERASAQCEELGRRVAELVAALA
jgi:NAD(P)H dehydrogenase (quinone)